MVDLLPDKLREKIAVHPATGCWVWTAAKHSAGYGAVSYDGKKAQLAHRVVYQLLKGQIPEGLQSDHLCRNRYCVNPEHIELVTSAENTRRTTAAESTRKRHRAKTHCPRGHAYSAANTRWYVKQGYDCRACRNCERDRQR